MSEFIDKVAKAIWEVNHPNPPGWAAWGAKDGFGPTPDERLFTTALARASISSMEPTPEMIEAGIAAWQETDMLQDSEVVKIIWNAMRADALVRRKGNGMRVTKEQL